MVTRRGRPEAPVQGTGAKAALAERLRLARHNAELTLQQLHELTGYSIATLSNAMKGELLPTWPVTAAIVKACGGDAAEWETCWKEAANQMPSLRLVTTSEDFDSPSPSPSPYSWHGSVGPSQQPSPIVHASSTYASTVFERVQTLAAAAKRFGPPPIPVSANTIAEFNDYLLRLQIWAGGISVRDLVRATGIPRSTLQSFLHNKNPNRLGKIDTLLAFLDACGVHDPVVVGEWAYAWRRLKYGETVDRRAAADTTSKRDTTGSASQAAA